MGILKDVRDYLAGMVVGSLAGYIGGELTYHFCDVCKVLPYTRDIFDRIFAGMGLVLGALFVYEYKEAKRWKALE